MCLATDTRKLEILETWSKRGSLVEIVSKKGFAKIYLLSLICTIHAIKDEKILYIDGSSNFRPELINTMIEECLEIDDVETNKLLQNIRYQRIFDINQCEKILKRINVMEVDCIIFDDMIPLFMHNSGESTRLRVRKIVRDMALLVLTRKITIIFTNIIVEKDINNHEKIRYENFYHDILRYIHLKIFVQMSSFTENAIESTVIYPKNIKESAMIIYIRPLA